MHLRTPFMKFGHKNPPLLENILSGKDFMQDVISPERKPQEWDGSHFASPTGYWIAKPVESFQQKGIRILSNRQLREWDKRNPGLFGYVVQVLEKTIKPDNAPDEYQGHNSFMRLRLDLIVRKDAKGRLNTQLTYGDSTMCVLPHKGRLKGLLLPGFANVDFSDGAHHFEASERETQQALEAVKSSISLIAKRVDSISFLELLRETVEKTNAAKNA
mgnify:FL=1